MKFFLLPLFLFCPPCFAIEQEATDQEFYKISDVQIVVEKNDHANAVASVAPVAKNLELFPFQELKMGELGLVGNANPNIIVAGKLVGFPQRDAVSVLPRNLSLLSRPDAWLGEVSQLITVKMVNKFGYALASVQLKLKAGFGGSINGKGQFLQAVSFTASDVHVSRLISFDVWAEFREPVNMASTTEDPLAGLAVDLRYKASTWVNAVTGARDFFITGDGRIKSDAN